MLREIGVFQKVKVAEFKSNFAQPTVYVWLLVPQDRSSPADMVMITVLRRSLVSALDVSITRVASSRLKTAKIRGPGSH